MLDSEFARLLLGLRIVHSLAKLLPRVHHNLFDFLSGTIVQREDPRVKVKGHILVDLLNVELIRRLHHLAKTFRVASVVLKEEHLNALLPITAFSDKDVVNFHCALLGVFEVDQVAQRHFL